MRRFVATVNRIETVKKLRKTFDALGSLGSTVQVRQSAENVKSVAESDVILLWCAFLFLPPLTSALFLSFQPYKPNLSPSPRLLLTAANPNSPPSSSSPPACPKRLKANSSSPSSPEQRSLKCASGSRRAARLSGLCRIRRRRCVFAFLIPFSFPPCDDETDACRGRLNADPGGYDRHLFPRRRRLEDDRQPRDSHRPLHPAGQDSLHGREGSSLFLSLSTFAFPFPPSSLKGRAERVEESDKVGRTLTPSPSISLHRKQHFDAVTAVCGSGPAFVCVVLEAMADGGVMMGLPRSEALELAAQSAFSLLSSLELSSEQG
jgi:hypothetical protein